MNMKIFITGASGFVGQNLINLIHNNSNIQLFTLLRKEKFANLKNFNIQPVYGNLFNLKQAEQIRNIDVIIHVAGLTKSLYPQNYYQINTKGTLEIIRFAKEKKVKQLIFVSSLAAFGPSFNKKPVTENSKPKPVSNYGLSKLIAEKLVIRSGIPYTIIRPPAVFGPGDKDILSYFKMVKSRIVLTSGDINNLYSMIYVKDIANFIKIVILNNNAINQDFFIGNKKFYRISDIIGAIEKSMERKSLKLNLPIFFTDIIFYPLQILYAFSSLPPLLNLDKLKELKMNNWICSSDKAKNLLNFTPEFNFHRAVKETTQWYLSKNWL